MKYCVYDAEGAILRTGFAPEVAHDLIRQAEQGRVLFFQADTPVDDTTHFVDPVNRVLHLIPERPTQWHQWVQGSRLWLGDVGALLAARRAAVEVERDRRIALPVTHDGCSVDADARAVTSIRDKLTTIAHMEEGGQELAPASCVWRDADNVMRTFESAPQYKDWLSRLLVAIEARNTEAMVWSWARKAALDKITEFDAALAFNPLE